MAFQTGTQVRPELGRADVSGFAKAGMITGQALANLGRDIGEGMEKYQKNKMITSTALASLEGTTAKNPEIITLGQEAGGDVAKAFKSIESGDYRMRDVLTAQGFAASYQEQKIAEQQSRLRETQIAAEQAKASQAAQSQNIEAINFNAKEQAIARNTRPDGSVDVAGLGSTYAQLGGRDAEDIEFFSDLTKQANAGKDPVIKTVIIDGFQVLLVDGEFKQARGVGGEEDDPAQVQVMKEKSQQFNKARELYAQGDVAGSQALLVGIGVKDMFGRPMQPGEAFPDVTPAVVTPPVLPAPLDPSRLTTDQIAAFREQYLTSQP